MRLSGERHVRLRVVLLSLRLSRAAAEVRSAVPRGRLRGAPNGRPEPRVPDDELVDVAGRSRVFRTQCAPSTPPALPTVPQGGASRALSTVAPESVHLVPNLVDRGLRRS